MTHYIAMAGLHGCMPNFCTSCNTFNDAVEVLADLHELGKTRKKRLHADHCIELNLKRDGNEYAEINSCICSTPEEHEG